MFYASFSFFNLQHALSLCGLCYYLFYFVHQFIECIQTLWIALVYKLKQNVDLLIIIDEKIGNKLFWVFCDSKSTYFEIFINEIKKQNEKIILRKKLFIHPSNPHEFKIVSIQIPVSLNIHHRYNHVRHLWLSIPWHTVIQICLSQYFGFTIS